MLSVSRNGIAAANQELDVISHNIANAGTTGFKRSTAQFEDMYTGVQKETSAPNLGLGATALAPRRSHAQGSIKETDQTLDLAIAGPGMFVVQSPTAGMPPQFTRNGTFELDKNNYLVTQSGERVLMSNGTDLQIHPQIKLPNDQTSRLTGLEVNNKGNIIATYGIDGKSTFMLGTLGLASFKNESGLRNEGDNLYSETNISGDAIVSQAGAAGMGLMQSGALERSNTDVTTEMVNLIRAQQAYSSNSRIMQTMLEMDRKLLE
ncbi:MAG: flagellar hook-basal body complex protein [Paracoccaceae bacterium]